MRKSKAKETMPAERVEEAMVSSGQEPPPSVAEAPASGSVARDMAVATAATVAVVGVGAVVFEVALIPGIVLGVAAALAPQLAPRVRSALNPVFRGAVGHSYRLGLKSRRVLAKAQDHVRDFVADVTAETGSNSRAKVVVGSASAE